MCTRLKIINQTEYPAITVEIDDKPLAKEILSKECSPTYPIRTGSVIVRIFQHTGRPFFNLWLAPAPNRENTLVVYPDHAVLL